MEKLAIKIKNMSFSYGEKSIFENFNLEIFSGTFTCIVGKNASGKSTLSKILCGLYEISKGYIIVDGYLLNNSNLSKIRRSIAVCFDDAASHFIGETVKDDLAFSLENLEYSKKETETSINNIAKKFKLEDLLEKGPSDLSESEKVKVMLASSLIHNPQILLLDNSLCHLTSTDRKLVFKVLNDYRKNNKLAVILITNNLEDTLMCDRIIALNRGKIVFDGTKEEAYSDEKFEKMGFELPFIVKLSHNLILYDLLDKVYFDSREAIDELWS